jgi:hypothetical protein
MTQSYLSHLPRKFMRIVSGHALEGTYFNARDTIQPPDELKRQVFPWIDNDLMALQNDTRGYERSISERGFVRLMDYLKIVFLQDAALLRRCWPDHPIFKDKLFQTDLYNDFANAVCQAEDNPNWPENKNIQAVVPEISAMLAGMRQENSIGFNRGYTYLDDMHRDIKRLDRRILMHDQTLQRLGMAQIEIPAVRAQLVMPPPHFPEETTTNIPSQSLLSQNLGTEAGHSILSTAAVIPTASSDDSVPQFQMDRSVMTVTELWEEWKHGRGGKPSVEELTEKWRHHWRDPKDRGWYQRREKLIKEIYMVAQKTGRQGKEGAVATEIEEFRLTNHKTLNYMCDNWVAQSRKARENQ